jgi:hypothetical protein
MMNHFPSSISSTQAHAAASWSAVTEMRGRSLASAAPLWVGSRHSITSAAIDSGVAPRLATALHDAGAKIVSNVLFVAIWISMIGLSSCNKKPTKEPQTTKPVEEAPKASWRDWIAKSTDLEWWKQQGAKASDAAKTFQASLDSINAEEVKKQANEIVKAIESQDVSKVEAVAGELGKRLSIEKLTEGLRFVVIQRQKGGEAAAKAIDEYAARPDLNEFEKIAAQNLKAGLSIAQRDDVRGLIAGAIFFACESKLGAHRGGFLAVPIISILFPELNEKHDYKP